MPIPEIIAEAGVNHNGSPDLARRMIDAAHSAGADCIKFQTFNASALASQSAQKADYQRATTGGDESQLAMLGRLALGPDAFRDLRRHAGEAGIDFLSTPFDAESLRFLVSEIGVSRIKMGSGDLTNGPLLWQVARTGLPAILSTGMGTLGEIEEALGVFAHAMVSDHPPSSRAELSRALSQSDHDGLAKRVTLLHCTTEYPTPPAEANLRAIETLRRAFGLPVGFSDHTDGIAVTLAAAALGASVIEKHLTLDRTLPGPDHRASIEPEMFKEMVSGIRTIAEALGDGPETPAAQRMEEPDSGAPPPRGRGRSGAGERSIDR